MKVLDLFSGIGGFSLGLERAGFETVGFCEIDPFCREVLAKHWPNVPIFEDVKILRGEDVGPVDVICGGYPCQPFSLAGERKGAEDDRHLWPEFMRLVAELRPTWVIGENVAGHISMGLDDVLSDLEAEGYAARSFNIPAIAIDAHHRRERIWTMAHTTSQRCGKKGKHCERSEERTSCRGSVLPDTNSIGRKRGVCKREIVEKKNGEPEGCEIRGALEQDALTNAKCGEQKERREIGRMGREWEPISGIKIGAITAKPLICRRTHGVPRRVDRLRALGNAVVPQIPEILGRAILAAHRESE